MSLHVEFEIQIEGASRVSFDGPQRVALTNATHACISGSVSINGVAYSHSTHLYRTANGSWALDSVRKGKDNHERLRDIYLSSASKEPSIAAKERAFNVIPALLSNALNELENIQELRKEAEIKSQEYYISVDMEEQKNLVAMLNALREKIQKRMSVLEDAKKGILPDEA